MGKERMWIIMSEEKWNEDWEEEMMSDEYYEEVIDYHLEKLNWEKWDGEGEMEEIIFTKEERKALIEKMKYCEKIAKEMEKALMKDERIKDMTFAEIRLRRLSDEYNWDAQRKLIEFYEADYLLENLVDTQLSAERMIIIEIERNKEAWGLSENLELTSPEKYLGLLNNLKAQLRELAIEMYC